MWRPFRARPETGSLNVYGGWMVGGARPGRRRARTQRGLPSRNAKLWCGLRPRSGGQRSEAVKKWGRSFMSRSGSPAEYENGPSAWQARGRTSRTGRTCPTTEAAWQGTGPGRGVPAAVFEAAEISRPSRAQAVGTMGPRASLRADISRATGAESDHLRDATRTEQPLGPSTSHAWDRFTAASVRGASLPRQFDRVLHRVGGTFCRGRGVSCGLRLVQGAAQGADLVLQGVGQ